MGYYRDRFWGMNISSYFDAHQLTQSSTPCRAMIVKHVFCLWGWPFAAKRPVAIANNIQQYPTNNAESPSLLDATLKTRYAMVYLKLWDKEHGNPVDGTGGTPNLLSPFCWYHHLFPGEPEGPMALQVDKLATTSRSCQTFPAWRFKYTAGSETLGRGFGGARDDLGNGQRQGSKHPRNYEPKIIHQCMLLFQGILCILAQMGSIPSRIREPQQLYIHGQ